MTGWNHGTMSGYKRHGCRCEPCTVACQTYNRQRYIKTKCGIKGYLDAEPVRRHVQRLLGNGWTFMQMEAASGIHRTCFRQMIEGHPRTGKVTQRVLPKTAAAVLALPLRPVFHEGAFYPRLHVTRRLQALQALGWTAEALGAELGISLSNVACLMGRETPARGSTCIRVADVYERLCMTVGPSSHVRQRAQAKGWHPPLAWDDIDDPYEEPEAITRPPSKSAQRVADAIELYAIGEAPEHIADRMGVKLASLQRMFHREHTPCPWPEIHHSSRRAA